MLSNIKVSTRLTALGVAVVLLTAVLVVVGYVMVSRIGSSLGDVRGLSGSRELAIGSDAIWELRFGIANYTLATPENRKKILDGRPKLYATLEESLKRYADLGPSQEQQTVLKDLQEEYRRYKAGAPRWFELIDAGKLEEAAEYRARVTNAAASAMVKNFNTLLKNQANQSKELTEESLATVGRARNLIVGTGLVIILITSVSAFLLVRSVTHSLEHIRATITKVEQSHDFTLRVPLNAGDEIGQTAKSFNDLMGTLQENLTQLLGAAAKVADKAELVSSASHQVAAGSSSQNNAATAMASAIQQLTASINSVSDGAREALQRSRDAGELSSRGAGIINKTAEGMSAIAETVGHASESIEELGQQSSRISSIVQVIKEVADQTNLLALNAAIEAARAGEQGRGFAVVADEVRKLAERTTKATEEITRMIASIQTCSQAAVSGMGGTVAHVRDGVSLANEAGAAIQEIRGSSASVVHVVDTISSALQEQRNSSNSIGEHVERVAQMTTANSLAASDTAEVAKALQELAKDMNMTLRQFRI